MIKTEHGSTIWELSDHNLPKEFEPIKRIFGADPSAERQRGESLHEYLLRKGLSCWCRDCRKQKAQKELEQNTSLEL